MSICKFDYVRHRRGQQEIDNSSQYIYEALESKMSIKQLVHRRLLARCLRAMQDLNSVNGADYHVLPQQQVHRTPHCVLTVPIAPVSFPLTSGCARAFRLNSEAGGRDLREGRDTGREEGASMR
jgi:hypothetical protein